VGGVHQEVTAVEQSLIQRPTTQELQLQVFALISGLQRLGREVELT
jgi:hypothetical protein